MGLPVDGIGVVGAQVMRLLVTIVYSVVAQTVRNNACKILHTVTLHTTGARSQVVYNTFDGHDQELRLHKYTLYHHTQTPDHSSLSCLDTHDPEQHLYV